MAFKKNVGMIDRIFRLLFGVFFIVAGYLYLLPPLSYAEMLVGVILVLTSLSGVCPLYGVLGVSTIGLPWCDITAEARKPVKAAARKRPRKRRRKK